jgi:heat shock protein HspQ
VVHQPEGPRANGRTIPKFEVGQLVRHRVFGYRGVIVSVDERFEGTERTYIRMARTRPHKDSPYYHVLVDQASHETYVAERNLTPDDSGEPIRHPFVLIHFDALVDGRYVLTRPLN